VTGRVAEAAPNVTGANCRNSLYGDASWILHRNDETMEPDASSDGFAMMQIDNWNMAA
jgi:hypothetical protein